MRPLSLSRVRSGPCMLAGTTARALCPCHAPYLSFMPLLPMHQSCSLCISLAPSASVLLPMHLSCSLCICLAPSASVLLPLHLSCSLCICLAPSASALCPCSLCIRPLSLSCSLSLFYAFARALARFLFLCRSLSFFLAWAWYGHGSVCLCLCHSSCGQDVGSWFSTDMHLDNYEIHRFGTNFHVLTYRRWKLVLFQI